MSLATVKVRRAPYRGNSIHETIGGIVFSFRPRHCWLERESGADDDQLSGDMWRVVFADRTTSIVDEPTLRALIDLESMYNRAIVMASAAAADMPSVEHTSHTTISEKSDS
jgi:hypothetical protein